MLSVPNELSAFLSRVLAHCPDICAAWSLGHVDADRLPTEPVHELLVFANRPTLDRLRKSDELHRADVRLLVVLDGDHFENAWGAHRQSGSLAGSGWRETAHDLAYFDEPHWVGDADVIRTRRKAVLMWRAHVGAAVVAID